MCEELVAIAGKTVVGDGLTAGTQLGPLQNLKQFERALEYIADGRKHGKVIAGGERLPGPGYFIPPTVVRDITDGSRLVDEEQFCPVLPVIKYTEIDEVIRGINTSSFGLGGSVWSSDPSRALAVAERLNVGMVWINKHCDVATHIPFAGSKASGVGVEFGQEGLLDFTQIHIINEPAAQAT
jgi:acyl-CoA reductase-like NAD-dependent aldehyde dehydrogenase